MRRVIIGLLCVVTLMYSGCHGEPPPVTACSSCGAVELVWLKSQAKGPINEAFVKDTAQMLQRQFGLNVSVHAPITIDAQSFVASRRQFDCDQLNTYLELFFQKEDGSTPSNKTRLAMTNADIFGGNWKFVYGCQRSHQVQRTGFGVVSSHELGEGDKRGKRAQTMLGKYIALMSCKTPPSMHPKHITYSKIRSPKDIDRMGMNVCWHAPSSTKPSP